MLGLIGNGRAGSVPRYQKRIAKAIHKLGGIARFPNDFENLDDVINEFRAEGVKTIVTLGGDGTNHQIISRAQPVFDRPVRYALLGKGTQNLMRRYLGATDSCPVEQLGAVADDHVRVLRKRMMRIDTLHTSHLGFLFGVGFPRNIMERYYDEGASRLKIITKVMWSALCRTEYVKSLTRPVDMEVTVDGESIPATEYNAVLMGTIRNVDPMHAPLYRADREDRAVHLIASSATPTQLLGEYFSVLRGRPLRCADKDQSIQEVTLRGNDLAYMIDGDLQSNTSYVADELTIRPGPTIEIVLPRR